MIETFKQNISVQKFLEDGNKLKIRRNESYHISYKEFLAYFESVDKITRHNLIIAINFTYGWMPTIFDFRSIMFVEAVEILNKAKQGIIPTKSELDVLKGLLNNSLVGTSKLLHFINPNVFAIWDSRVYRYLTGKEPYQDRIGNCDTYFDYLKFCHYLTQQNEFEVLQKKIEEQVGYSLTPFRIAELIMYSNGQKANAKNST